MPQAHMTIYTTCSYPSQYLEKYPDIWSLSKVEAKLEEWKQTERAREIKEELDISIEIVSRETALHFQEYLDDWADAGGYLFNIPEYERSAWQGNEDYRRISDEEVATAEDVFLELFRFIDGVRYDQKETVYLYVSHFVHIGIQ